MIGKFCLFALVTVFIFVIQVLIDNSENDTLIFGKDIILSFLTATMLTFIMTYLKLI